MSVYNLLYIYACMSKGLCRVRLYYYNYIVTMNDTSCQIIGSSCKKQHSNHLISLIDLEWLQGLGSYYLAEGSLVFKLNPHLKFYLCMRTHMRVQSSAFIRSSAELHVGFLMRLELLAGFTFARLSGCLYLTCRHFCM